MKTRFPSHLVPSLPPPGRVTVLQGPAFLSGKQAGRRPNGPSSSRQPPPRLHCRASQCRTCLSCRHMATQKHSSSSSPNGPSLLLITQITSPTHRLLFLPLQSKTTPSACYREAASSRGELHAGFLLIRFRNTLAAHPAASRSSLQRRTRPFQTGARMCVSP